MATTSAGWAAAEMDRLRSAGGGGEKPLEDAGEISDGDMGVAGEPTRTANGSAGAGGSAGL
jgi:hypothetical protein